MRPSAFRSPPDAPSWGRARGNPFDDPALAASIVAANSPPANFNADYGVDADSEGGLGAFSLLEDDVASTPAQSRRGSFETLSGSAQSRRGTEDTVRAPIFIESKLLLKDLVMQSRIPVSLPGNDSRAFEAKVACTCRLDVSQGRRKNQYVLCLNNQPLLIASHRNDGIKSLWSSSHYFITWATPESKVAVWPEIGWKLKGRLSQGFSLFDTGVRLSKQSGTPRRELAFIFSWPLPDSRHGHSVVMPEDNSVPAPAGLSLRERSARFDTRLVHVSSRVAGYIDDSDEVSTRNCVLYHSQAKPVKAVMAMGAAQSNVLSVVVDCSVVPLVIAFATCLVALEAKVGAWIHR